MERRRGCRPRPAPGGRVSPEQRHWLAVHLEPALLAVGIFLAVLVAFAWVEKRRER